MFRQRRRHWVRLCCCLFEIPQQGWEVEMVSQTVSLRQMGERDHGWAACLSCSLLEIMKMIHHGHSRNLRAMACKRCTWEALWSICESLFSSALYLAECRKRIATLASSVCNGHTAAVSG